MKKLVFILSFLFFTLLSNAQTGIGTTTPVNKFQVETNVADPLTLGNNVQNGHLRLTGIGVTHMLDVGLMSSTSNFGTWIQARKKDNFGVNYNLLLNPNGGNIGIGTTNPTAKLNISGGGIRIATGFNNSSTRPALNTTTIGNYEVRAVGAGGSGSSQIDGADDGFLRLSAGGGNSSATQAVIELSGFSTVADMNSNIVMRTAGLERFRIDLNGNVGIGTSAPSTKLHVNGDITANSISGNSDLRFKTNIRSVTKALDKIKLLKGVYFNWNQKAFPEKDFGEQDELGFIAQEVEKIVPEIVTKDKTKDEFRSVKYDKLVALLVEAIKEQQKQIDSLNFKVNKLSKSKNK
jgi:Chaperone of endosialidase